jgi:chaperonin GroES
MIKLTETPLDNRLILKEDEAPTKTASGIHLPNESQEKPYKGTVMAVGPLCTLKAGDRVRYAQRAGDKITEAGQDYLTMRETDIYTKLKK